MAIPPFRRPEGVLPSGIHPASLKEVEERFGFSPKRRELIKFGLLPVCEDLKKMNLEDLYLGGSFVTGKLFPGDIDGYAILKFDSSAHQEFVQLQERWRTHHRVDLFPAFVGLGGCSPEEWEDLFSGSEGRPGTGRGLVRLLLRR